MPVRWVISPVVASADGKARWPKVAYIEDLGREPYEITDDDGNKITQRPVLSQSSVIETQNWCLSFVRGVSLASLDADPSIIQLELGDYEDADRHLEKTPRILNWGGAKLARVKKRLSDRGADVSGLDQDAQLWVWLRQLGKILRADFTGPAGTWTK